jgi:hypothetical protein
MPSWAPAFPPMNTIPAPESLLRQTAFFQLEQSSTALHLASRECWERLRLLDSAGNCLRESRATQRDSWDLQGLSPGVYWVVGEWPGTRSSRAVVIGAEAARF